MNSGNPSAACIPIGIITVSDRSFRGEYQDQSGPAIRRYLSERIDDELAFHSAIVPDVLSQIAGAIATHTDQHRCCLVLTTGGTGPQSRDVTPEATELVSDKLLPGIGEKMRIITGGPVPSAILSRQIASLRGTALVVNLPGNPRAIAQCLDAVFPAIVHGVNMASGREINLVTIPPGIPEH